MSPTCHWILILWNLSLAALQLGLVEREISDLLRGIHRVQTPQQGRNNENAQIEEDGYIKQKEISSDDICSICQEVLLEKKVPVTFCRWHDFSLDSRNLGKNSNLIYL